MVEAGETVPGTAVLQAQSQTRRLEKVEPLPTRPRVGLVELGNAQSARAVQMGMEAGPVSGGRVVVDSLHALQSHPAREDPRPSRHTNRPWQAWWHSERRLERTVKGLCRCGKPSLLMDQALLARTCEALGDWGAERPCDKSAFDALAAASRRQLSLLNFAPSAVCHLQNMPIEAPALASALLCARWLRSVHCVCERARHRCVLRTAHNLQRQPDQPWRWLWPCPVLLTRLPRQRPAARPRWSNEYEGFPH